MYSNRSRKGRILSIGYGKHGARGGRSLTEIEGKFDGERSGKLKRSGRSWSSKIAVEELTVLGI
jgi:hypothetical protein